MTDSILQLTMREMRTLATSIRAVAVIVAVIVVLGISGPFQTYEYLTLLPRLGYWAAICVLTYSIGAFFSTYASIWLNRRGAGRILHILVAGTLAGLPVAPVIIAVNLMVFEDYEINLSEMVATLFYALVISFLVIILMQLFRPTAAEKSANTAAPKLMSRLNIANRGALVSLTVQDHYVEVCTTKGKELILMRLTDAVAETDGAVGLQIHRSHWVALDQVLGNKRQDGRVMVETSAGDLLPISRTYLAAAREAGLVS